MFQFLFFFTGSSSSPLRVRTLRTWRNNTSRTCTRSAPSLSPPCSRSPCRNRGLRSPLPAPRSGCRGVRPSRRSQGSTLGTPSPCPSSVSGPPACAGRCRGAPRPPRRIAPGAGRRLAGSGAVRASRSWSRRNPKRRGTCSPPACCTRLSVKKRSWALGADCSSIKIIVFKFSTT